MFTSQVVLHGLRLSYTVFCLHWRESTNRATFASLSNLLSQEPKHYLMRPSIAVLSVICSVQGASQTKRDMEIWGHPLEGFCQAKKTLYSKKSQIFCIIKQNNTTV